MNGLEETISKLSLLIKTVDDQLKLFERARDDELFVEFGYDHRNEQDIHDWFFENNIVAKRESISFDRKLFEMTPIESVYGYRFKAVEDAAAFKLRWI